ncbi:hypothetical protein GEMRC1_010608 [Eukaryota sp. GEM-RC1]
MTVWISPKAWYQNLKAHVLSHHKNWPELLSSNNSQPKASTFTTAKSAVKSTTIYGWLDWLISEQKPFSTVEKAATRNYSWLAPISRDTLVHYLTQTYFEAFNSVKRQLPQKFGIVVDGWRLESTSTEFLLSLHLHQEHHL